MPTTNAKQLDLLVAFMETNPNIAKNYLPTSQAKSKILWKALTDKLNACGPPEKPMDGWKSVTLEEIKHQKQLNSKMGFKPNK